MNISATSKSAIDPVCGMTVDPATAAATSTRDGETIYFCSRHCKSAFDAQAPATTGCACRSDGHSAGGR